LHDRAKPEAMDLVIALTRSHRTARMELVMTDGRVAAVVDKPRLYYVPTPALQQSGPGSAVFTVDGGFVGLMVLQRTPKGETWAVIVPAEDIAETAQQVPVQPAGGGR
ncbi:MAG: hypothetical protein N3B01_01030, partial [Verrucomicrobiae bacterium]|nr:hypothetical protein [Verrucomicrobiae bacterium]